MRVAIIGGGVSGLSTALIFKHLLPKYNVKLFEKSSQISLPSSLYLGLWNPTFKILQDLGLYEEIQQMICPIRQFQYYNLSTQLLMETSSFNQPPSISCMYPCILTFLEKVRPNVELNSTVRRVYRNHTEAVIEFDNSESYYADFVIAADGSNSLTRRSVSGLEAIPQRACGYSIFRGHSSNHRCEQLSQTLGAGTSFTRAPTLKGVAWSVKVNNKILHDSNNTSSKSEMLISLLKNYPDETTDLIRTTDGGDHGIFGQEITESTINYQGWDAILKYSNGTTAPSPDDPLVIKPTAIEDAKKMGYVSTENEQNSNAGVKRISYREALANGMWRVRTAPLVFYVGDSAYHMDPILSQGAGLGIEGAYRLAKTLQDSKFSQKLLQNKEENKGFDFDDLMPDLMECENQRYFRYLRLKRLTTLMNSFQDTNSSITSQIRNGFFQSTPSSFKKIFIDNIIEKSLYY